MKPEPDKSAQESLYFLFFFNHQSMYTRFLHQLNQLKCKQCLFMELFVTSVKISTVPFTDAWSKYAAVCKQMLSLYVQPPRH